MSKLYLRLAVLVGVIVCALIPFLLGIYVISCLFCVILGFILGIIAMKERDALEMFTLSHGVKIDKGDAEDGKK